MKVKFVEAYMDVAERFAQLSSATRLKVGAIAVKDDRIISIGYNGTVSGWDNTCEEKDYMPYDAPGWIDDFEEQWPYEESERRYKLVTKQEVVHAESNCISKLAKSNESGQGASMFITHSPCVECAKLIYQSGIIHVYYKNSYRDCSGVDFLKKCGVNVLQFPVDTA